MPAQRAVLACLAGGSQMCRDRPPAGRKGSRASFATALPGQGRAADQRARLTQGLNESNLQGRGSSSVGVARAGSSGRQQRAPRGTHAPGPVGCCRCTRPTHAPLHDLLDRGLQDGAGAGQLCVDARLRTRTTAGGGRTAGSAERWKDAGARAVGATLRTQSRALLRGGQRQHCGSAIVGRPTHPPGGMRRQRGWAPG